MTALLGCLLFGSLLALLVTSPDLFERTALGFAKAEVTAKMESRLSGTTVESGLRNLIARMDDRQDRLQRIIESDLPDLVGTVVANYCRCTPATQAETDAAAARIRQSLKGQIGSLDVAQGKLARMIEGEYDSVITGLRRDLTIFLGSNLAAFLLIGLASFVPTRRRNLIIYPTVLLCISVAVCSGFYLFNTDWFYRLLFQNFIGFGYTAWLAVLFLLLADITMNEARVTMKLISNLPNVLVPPC